MKMFETSRFGPLRQESFMPDCSAAPRFTLRQLPLPAKLVVTLFLLTVGLGYSSAPKWAESWAK